VTIELANKMDRKETLKKEVRQKYKSLHKNDYNSRWNFNRYFTFISTVNPSLRHFRGRFFSW